MSSGYVHPGPITAVNHKGKQCRRRFCHIFAFVSQPDPHSGRWEHTGNVRHLSNRIDNRGINMQRHVSGRFWGVRLYGWMWVHPHACISKRWIKADFCLCNDLTISPSEWGWILLDACMREGKKKRRRGCWTEWSFHCVAKKEKRKIKCVWTHILMWL